MADRLSVHTTLVSTRIKHDEINTTIKLSGYDSRIRIEVGTLPETRNNC